MYSGTVRGRKRIDSSLATFCGAFRVVHLDHFEDHDLFAVAAGQHLLRLRIQRELQCLLVQAFATLHDNLVVFLFAFLLFFVINQLMVFVSPHLIYNGDIVS